MAPIGPQEAADSFDLTPENEEYITLLMETIDSSLRREYSFVTQDFVFSLSKNDVTKLSADKNLAYLRKQYKTCGWANVEIESHGERFHLRFIPPYHDM